jgi:hypothetical protein
MEKRTTQIRSRVVVVHWPSISLWEIIAEKFSHIGKKWDSGPF